ncbi:hypothetical protein BK785_23475 [Bacillus thuringiensis serovar bolivia]|uniref:Uncharacterized protein n=2 Tax=Bacillaceae TaxID=186817 RepID=A0A9X6BCW2_BACCE|nr:hypothetical protein BLX06_00455 [Bacillus cereus]OUA52703.1 hypothetical protein BK785_23475 [Bacillus thuringiensis serovar bolivia]OUA72339.1 hypothetical protein BK787_27825 [Bacillus thuringiensis serovar pahangi]
MDMSLMIRWRMKKCRKERKRMSMTEQQMIEHLVSKGMTILSEGQKNQMDAYRDKRERQDKKHFAWQNTVNHVSQSQSLTDIQKGSLLIMSTFLEFEGEGKCHDTKGAELTNKKFAKLIGKSLKTANRILDDCESIGAITLEKSGRDKIIKFTDMLYTCGKPSGDKKQFVKVFKLAVRDLIQTFNLKELGLFADLLPHFHWKTHILCENPTEMDVSKIKVWRRKDIIEKLGYNKDKLPRMMTRFKRNRATIEISSTIDVICLSPSLVSRQSDKVTLDDIEKVAQQIADDLTSKSYC